MTRVVLIHGIGQQTSTSADQVSQWLPSLVKGVLRAGRPDAGRVAAALSTAASDPGETGEVRMAFYGDLFLTPGLMGEDTITDPATAEVAEAFAAALLRTAIQRGDERLASEARVTLAQADPTREGVQRAGAVTRGVMSRLDGNRWLAQCAHADLEQVARYLTEDPLRADIQARVSELLGPDTDLVIAHSLGSVVGWEVLSRYEGTTPTLLTIGSPLGLNSVVYPRLRPSPPTFPPPVRRWVNVAHPDDIIAVEPRLEHFFPSADGRKVEDHNPRSRRNHHAADVYLEQPEVGRAIVDALAS